MQITPTQLTALAQGFQTAFLQGLASVQPQYSLVAMEVNSKAATENYAWMKDIAGMREWIGDRVINNLESVVYQLVNKHYEHTIGIKRTEIEDDILGIYTNKFQMQGEIVARHPNTLVWQALLAGFATVGLDGQYFFDTDHVAYDATGAETTYSNRPATLGSGAPWFLMDLSRTYMKPLILQKRQAPRFIQQTQDNLDSVFERDEYRYGVDARYAAGYGFHQLAYGSKSTLDAAAYVAARVAMGTQKRPDGASLDVTPTHLLVGPSNESAARLVVGLENISGSTNPWWKTAEIVVVPSLG